MRLESGELIAGKYRIESLLGEGGMGAVYVATNEMLRKSVAFKIMNEQLLGTDGVQRFFREGVATSRVRHRSVVEVFDAGEHQGAPWMAMELLEGESLGARLERLGPMQPTECVLMARELLAGLAAAHAQGIVHRDLKPENIYLERHADGSVQPKILDFGIAKLTDQGPAKLTQHGAVVGTVSHLSPEQARGEADVDGRADIFAMGVVMFEALSARLPFEDETVPRMVARIVSGDATQLRTVAPAVPEKLAALIHRCLSRERDQRPASADELARLLSDSIGVGETDRSRLYLTEPSDASRTSLVGVTLEDRYRVVRKIGSGGMGDVFEVEHLRIGRRFALKTLRVELATNPEALGRFEREARAAGAIGNEHIIEVSDMGRLPTGEPFIVMEMLEGRDLHAELADVGTLPVARAMHIATQICRALAAAHDKGIIHRDLKPENVFLLSNRSDPDFVKVLDFGISKVRDAMQGVHGDVKTQTGVALGTPHYMAPEQADGRPNVDARADIYAMGVMLFRMLTGELPYDAPTFTALLLKVAQEPPPSLRARREEIPGALEALVQRAMAKDPADRFASMTDMAEALIAAGTVSTGEEAMAATEEAMPALPDDYEPSTTPSVPTTTERQEPVIFAEDEASVPMSRPLPVAAIAVAVGVLGLGVAAVVIVPKLNTGHETTTPDLSSSAAATSTASTTANETASATADSSSDAAADASATPSSAASGQPATPVAAPKPTAATRSTAAPTSSTAASPSPSSSAAPASAQPAAQRSVMVGNRNAELVRVMFSCDGTPQGVMLPPGTRQSLSLPAVACGASCSGKGSPTCASQLTASQLAFEVN